MCDCGALDCCDVCRDWEPSEEQLLAQTPLAKYQRHTEYLVSKYEREGIV